MLGHGGAPRLRFPQILSLNWERGGAAPRVQPGMAAAEFSERSEESARFPQKSAGCSDILQQAGRQYPFHKNNPPKKRKESRPPAVRCLPGGGRAGPVPRGCRGRQGGVRISPPGRCPWVVPLTRSQAPDKETPKVCLSLPPGTGPAGGLAGPRSDPTSKTRGGLRFVLF